MIYGCKKLYIFTIFKAYLKLIDNFSTKCAYVNKFYLDSFLFFMYIKILLFMKLEFRSFFEYICTFPTNFAVNVTRKSRFLIPHVPQFVYAKCA